ncbi:MAG: hypothetical protein OHK0029_35260 [Armatimonadaceae bacterium]
MIVLLPLVALGILIGWRINQKNAEAAEQAASREARGKAPVPVQAVPVVRDTLQVTFTATGTLEAPLAVEIAPRISGRLVYLQLREGDRIEQGQVLARLDTAEIDAEVRRKEAAVAQAKARLAEGRLGQNPTDINVQTAIRQAEAALSTALAQQRQAQADYDQRIAAAEEAVTAAQGRVQQAEAGIATAEAQITTAQASLDNARIRLERQDALAQRGMVAVQSADDARTNVAIREGTLREAQQQKESAVAAKSSAVAQQKAAEKQALLTRNQAKATVEVARQVVRQAEAALASARGNIARRSAYQQNIEALEAAVAAAEADLRLSLANRNATTMVAPLSGVVTRRYLDPGALATPTNPILAVQSTRDIWVNFGVPEEVRRRLSVGQTAQVTVDSAGGGTFSGRILRLNPSADPQTRQFTVRVMVENGDRRLQPGSSATVQLNLEEFPNVLTVPREAVQTSRNPAEKPTVVVAEGETAKVREVTLGESDGKRVIVRSGLSEGDSVVILAGRQLKEGQAIKPEAPTNGASLEGADK